MPGKNGGNHAITITTWTILKVVLVLVGVALLWFLKDVLAMLFVALLLAALIDPFANWFDARHIPRGIAVLIIYLLLLLVFGLVVVLLIPPLVTQSTQLIQTLGYSGEIGSFIQEVKRVTTGVGIQGADSLLGVIQGFSSTITNFVGSVGALALVLVLTFYMVVEEQAVTRLFHSVAPQEYQPYLAQLFARMREKIGAWLRGQIFLGVVVGVLTFIGLSIFDIRYALVLALIAGVFEIIPYVGPILAAIPAVALTFVDSPTKGGIVLIIYLIIQQLENNLLVPRVMQKVAGLNPLVSIVALVIGLRLGGVVGAIFAIPVAMMVSVVLQDLFYDQPAFEE